MRISIIIPFVITAFVAFLYFSDRYDRDINSDEITMYQCKISMRLPFWDDSSIADLENPKAKHEPYFEKNKNYLTIRNTNIKQIPNDAFKDFPCLEEVNFTYNQLETIPFALTDLPNLREIILQSNQLTTLNTNTLSELTTLKFLDFSKNPIKKLAIPNTKSELEEFICSNCELESIDTMLHNIVLERINLSKNYLSNFPVQLLNSHNLNTLLLNNNRIQSFDFDQENVSYLHKTTLTTLGLSYNRLIQFPSGVHHFPNLEHLYLDGNNLSGELNIKGLLYLNKLEIIDQNLTSVVIDSMMYNNLGEKIPIRQFLPSTGIIDLHNNKIEKFTVLSGENYSVHLINLSKNALEEFSNSFYKFKRLEELNLSFNQLEKIIIDKRFENKLKIFNLSNNQIKEIKNAFSTNQLNDFEVVDLSHNRLTQIPYQFLFNSLIQTLDLSYNNIKNMVITKQSSNEKWNHIKTLNLSNNPITSWDNSINELPFLQTIDLSNTYIENIPFKDISTMPHLNLLILKDTKIPKLTLESIQQNLAQYGIKVIY